MDYEIKLSNDELNLLVESLLMYNRRFRWDSQEAKDLLKKVQMAKGSYINYESLDKMTPEEADEFYDGLIETFLGRKPKEE